MGGGGGGKGEGGYWRRMFDSDLMSEKMKDQSLADKRCIIDKKSRRMSKTVLH